MNKFKVGDVVRFADEWINGPSEREIKAVIIEDRTNDIGERYYIKYKSNNFLGYRVETVDVDWIRLVMKAEDVKEYIF